MIISINSRSWGWVMVIRPVLDFGELVKVALKGEGEGVCGWGKRYSHIFLLHLLNHLCDKRYLHCRKRDSQR
jgi:hypothetical protein